MATIQAVSLEEALSSRSQKQPSQRTLRTRALEEDADQVVQAVQTQGAAQIDFSEEEGAAERYLSGLRSALSRKGHTNILLQKKRGLPQATAWQMRGEDQGRVEKRKQTGARLGQVAKDRARTRRRGR